MGSYAYCHHCDASMSRPTLREALTDTWTCCNGHTRELIDTFKEHLVEDFEALIERVEKIEAALKPDTGETHLCDCERSHNGMGMTGRECDCPAALKSNTGEQP